MLRQLYSYLAPILLGIIFSLPAPAVSLARGVGEKATAFELVNPFSGTANDGNEFPGATMPFGMIQWSPDTGPHRRSGGYNYADSIIYGFSVDHLSGAGCYYGGDFTFSPLLGTEGISAPVGRTTFPEPFSHENESAHPGYYRVKLDNGIKVELTTTLRTGFGRFSFPPHGTPTVVINAASNIMNGFNEFTTDASVTIEPRSRSISGGATGGYFCGTSYDTRTIYFYAVFNRPFASYGTWGGSKLMKNNLNGEGVGAGAYVTFDASQGRTVLVKIGVSYVSVANAKQNLEMENSVARMASGDFTSAVRKARRVWNLWLNRVSVSGGTLTDRRTFYSMVYHTLLGPTICSDVNGEYPGSDGKVHVMPRGHLMYSDFSGWDIYRSEAQWLAIMAPRHSGDMAQSLLLDYEQGGTFPRWPVPNMDSGVMMGDPAAPIIADFYAFGVRNFEVSKAFQGLMRAATDTSVYAPLSHTYERDALGEYLALGYVPEHQKGGYGNVSMTLEYGAADFALSRMAKALGFESDAALLLKHAQGWENLYNPATGYMQMKRQDGSWAPGFSDSVGSYDHDDAYVEGTAAQYVWAIPYNESGLAEKMGGIKVADSRLDKFFTEMNAGTNSVFSYLGNEPCLETPWIYDFFGKPYKTQALVRRAIDTLYSYRPLGFPGNDDLGEMASWYIFGALGIYPELPGSDIMVIGSPLFSKAKLHLHSGTLTIIGHGAKDDAPYVRRLTLNGKELNKTWFRFREIAHGGSLAFDLSTKPDTHWGSAPEDAAPSYR